MKNLKIKRRKSSEILRILTKFLNFDQISEFQPNFGISAKFRNFNQILEIQPNSRISTTFQNFYQSSFTFSMFPQPDISKCKHQEGRFEGTCLLFTIFSCLSSSMYTYLPTPKPLPFDNLFQISADRSDLPTYADDSLINLRRLISI